MSDLTGPYAAIAPPILTGELDYFDFINKKKGGIDGVPVEALWTDVKQDAALSVNAYKRFKSEGCLAVSVVSSTQAFAVKRLADEDKLPVVAHASNLALYVPPSDGLWCQTVSNAVETIAVLLWFDTKVWDRTKMGRTWKIGTLIWDSAYTKGSLPGLYKYCDDNGIEIVGTEIVPPAALDFSINIKRLVAAGANVIYIGLCGANAGVALKQMGELGILAPLEKAIATPGKVITLTNDCTIYPANLLAARAETAYIYGPVNFASWWEMDKFSGAKDITGWMIEKYGEIWKDPKDPQAYSVGWNNAYIIVSAIERAVKAVGWDKLDSVAVIEKGLKGARFEPILTGDLSYADSPSDRIAIEMVRVGAWDAEKWTRKPISDFFNIGKDYRQYYVTKYTPKKPHPGMYVE